MTPTRFISKVYNFINKYLGYTSNHIHIFVYIVMKKKYRYAILAFDKNFKLDITIFIKKKNKNHPLFLLDNKGPPS